MGEAVGDYRKNIRRGASRMRGLVESFMHGPAALAGLSLGLDWMKSNNGNSPTRNAFLTATVDMMDRRKISCDFNDLYYRVTVVLFV